MLANNAELLPNLDPRPLIKRLARFVLALHMPDKGYSPTHHVQMHEPEDGLWTHEGHIKPEDIFIHRDYQPPTWVGLPYYTGDPTEELSVEEIRLALEDRLGPDGRQAVFNKEEFGEHLDGAA